LSTKAYRYPMLILVHSMKRLKAENGFTIIELMVVIALIAIIAGFAVPQFGRVIENNRVISTTNSVVGLVNFARSEAIRRGVRVTVTSASNSVSATLTSDGSLIRRIEEAAGSITVTAGAITFRSNGMTTNAGDLQLDICSATGNGRQITVSPGGRIDTTEINCP